VHVYIYPYTWCSTFHRLVAVRKSIVVLLNAPRYDDVLESGGIVPRVLKLSTRWR
jgi:hypothetical protein